MARRQAALRSRVLALLSHASDGLALDEIVRAILHAGEPISSRGVRDLLTVLVDEQQIVRRRQPTTGPGAPPYIYYHPAHAPRDASALDQALERGFGQARADVATRSRIEFDELRGDESERQRNTTSVLVRIAQGMLEDDAHAAAVFETAQALAALDPVSLVIAMAEWTVDDLNSLAARAETLLSAGRHNEVEHLATELDTRLAWARRYFQGFWRLDRGVPGAEPVLDIPRSAAHYHHHQQRAVLYTERARARLRERLIGDRLVEIVPADTQAHTVVAGTDASVADIHLERGTPVYGGTTSVSVMSAAAALVHSGSDGVREYQDFDVFPDQLHQLADQSAAARGFILSPAFRHLLPERDFRHSRMAALELRQYDAELRIVLRDAKWRPLGAAPSLGIDPRPSMIVRDGRTFPLVHRIRDYESPGLYGQIVRNQIERFSQVLHHAFSGPAGPVVYGAVVKSPEMSWLSPLVFWYLHTNAVSVRGQRVVAEAGDVYRPPLADSAVAHLIFAGLHSAAGTSINSMTDTTEGRTGSAPVFRTCVAVRHFADIAFDDESLPIMVTAEGVRRRPVQENSEEDWQTFLRERARERFERDNEPSLQPAVYRPFVYLCAYAGVAMCYGAPAAFYATPSGTMSDVPQFLLPRLETAIDLRMDDVPAHLTAMLGWMAAGNATLSRHADIGDAAHREGSLPVLVPDVVALAHDAAAFAKRALGNEVQDELRRLVAALRQQLSGRGSPVSSV